MYPVQGNAMLLPPYSLRLSDYATSVSERLLVNTLLTDVTKAELQVRLRLSITGQNVKLETKPEYIGTTLILQGGVPLRLTNVELAEYFDVNHLNFSGLSKSEFMKTGFLPEGFYTFCWEVYEAHRNVKISNALCAPAWLVLNDPPIVNLPRNGEKLTPMTPQNIIFQWTPRHTGSPNSAFTTEYEVKVVEVWPATRNANDAILSQPAIYETTTSSTTLIYGPDATQLEPGRRYALRVQAKAMSGTEQTDLFKNNGYSETVSFIYGDACDAPANIVAQTASPTRFTLQWDEGPAQTGYTVRYREAGKENANWYTTTTGITTAEISGLQAGTAYEYEVMSTCGNFESSYSTVATFTTDALAGKGYSCGVVPPDFNLDPSQLLPVLKVGEVVNAGDFEVTITKVSGSAGTFSGEGAVVVPFLNQVRGRVVFDNITVNNDKRMVNGFMKVTGGGIEIVPGSVLNAMDQLSQVLNVADSVLSLARQFVTPVPDANTFVADTLIKIKGGITKVYKDVATGNIIVVDNNGNTQSLPAGKNLVLTDEQGKGVLVNKEGGVTNTTATLAGATKKRVMNLSLTFAKSADTKYGFDEEKIEALKSNYEKLSESYFVAWKAVPTEAGDVVAATYTGKETTADKIKFEQEGTPLTATVTGTAIQLTVYAVAVGARSSVVAKIVPTDTTKKEQIIGKLNVVGYERKPVKLHIVPVNKVSFTTDPATIQTQLNKIYGQAVVSWEVEVAKQSLQVSGPKDPFDDGSSGLLSNYTDDMKMVINAQGELKEGEYYLFLIDKGASGSKLGYMPRSKQAGFIFTDLHGGDLTRMITTMAHELGHGAFTLKHTFAEYNSLSERSTDNLMDYNNGTQLLKYQWDQIHNPAIVLGLFESDESGARVASESDLFPFLEKVRYSFRTNNYFQMGDYSPFTDLPRIPGMIKQSYVQPTLPYFTGNFTTTDNQKFQELSVYVTNEYQKIGQRFYIGQASIERRTSDQVYPTAKAGSPVIRVRDKATGDLIMEIYYFDYLSSRQHDADLSTLTHLYNYLFNKASYVTLFVEGYTKVPILEDISTFLNTENPKPADLVSIEDDHSSYWKGIDTKFVELLGGAKCIRAYAKGHHPIITSNHNVKEDIQQSKLKFLRSLISSSVTDGTIASYTLPVLASTSFAIPPAAGLAACFHNPSCVILNTTPNPEGFTVRKTNGRNAGIDLVSQLLSMDFDKANGKVDVIAHSMGFAYAQGIIEVLKEKGYALGRYYILAPENPGSGGVNLSDFEDQGNNTVWQYGSNETADNLWEQDGVAPQVPVVGLEQRRAYIPATAPKSFLDCHWVENYGWIFEIRDSNKKGYVKRR